MNGKKDTNEKNLGEDTTYNMERCLSGRKCRSRKAVGRKASWVRIPPSPHSILNCMTHIENIVDREIVITRVIDAPRERVWQAWTTPEELKQWWGPEGFTNTFHEIDMHEGGVWRFTMHGPDGVEYPNRIIFTEIDEPKRLVYTHDSDKENDPEQFQSTITFEETENKTTITMRSLFATASQRDEVAEKYHATVQEFNFIFY